MLENLPCTSFECKAEAILCSELIPALGCTEPIAVALASSKAAETLEALPERIDLHCSGNIIKNVKGVTVPNSGGRFGLEIAAAMGVVSGQSARGLEVLEGLSPEQLERAVEMVDKGCVHVYLAEGIETLYVRVIAFRGQDESEVILSKSHTNISYIRHGKDVLKDSHEKNTGSQSDDRAMLSMSAILHYAKTVDLDKYPKVQDLLRQQIEYNSAIAEEGLKGAYGVGIGQLILQGCHSNDLAARARAYAAAGSDARMDGCSLPVIINSGSGNQGMTVSLPVIQYARDIGASKETLYRALLVSNLTAIYQKGFIGKLSAFCGAVSAAAGAGAGIAFLKGMDDETVEYVVSNTIAISGGMVCDGAKASCAAKIATALESAFLGLKMSQNKRKFRAGEGIVGEDVDETVQNVGRMAREGMRGTDVEILHIMTRE